MSCSAVRYDPYVHGPARPLSRIPARLFPPTNSFLPTYPAYLSLHRSNIFCFRFFLPAVHVACPHSSWGRVSPPVLSRTRVFWWFPTGLSFYFTFPALPSSSIYLLLTKHTIVVHVFQYLFCIYVCRFSPQILYSSCSWVILSAANIVVCTPFISPSPPRHLVIWLPFTCLHTFFFCLKLFRRLI